MIIDAHLHLWDKQHGMVNGKPVYDIGGGKSDFGGVVKQMMPAYMNDGVNSVENTNRLIEELVEAGVQFEMQLYPNKDESFTASLLQPHLYNRIVNFLKNNVK